MSDVALSRRIAALVVMVLLSVIGASVASATIADSADARPGDGASLDGGGGHWSEVSPGRLKSPTTVANRTLAETLAEVRGQRRAGILRDSSPPWR